MNEVITQIRTQRLTTIGGETSENVFTFSKEVYEAIVNAFHEIDHEKRGIIRCVDLIRVLEVIEIGVDEERIQALLGELGASYDTQITLPECIDLLALLMESTE